MKRLVGWTALVLGFVVVATYWFSNRDELSETQKARKTVPELQRVDETAASQPKEEMSGFAAGQSSQELGSTPSSYKNEARNTEAPIEASARPGVKRSSDDAWKSAPPLSKSERASVQKIIDLAFKYAKPTEKPSALLRELEALKLAPVAAQDFNDDTGKMVIIRTDQALDGTRYFHAQFFEDENKKTYLQHLSFEIRPSPDSMDLAVKMIEAKLGVKIDVLQAPTSHYALYKAPNDYIVWVKRLERDDLKDDPFNARDPKADIGTLRVAIEKDIHAHEHE